MLKAREAVLHMREYHPPLAGRTGLRLDFNENTSGCSPAVLQRLRNISAEELNRYPERAPVESAVAGRLALQAEQVLLTNGVDEAIHLVCETFVDAGDEAIIVTPTFGMYEVFMQQTGARVIATESNTGDFSFPLERVLAHINDRTRLVAFASPNNPTGGVVAKADIYAILNAAPHAAILVDEAYFDFYGETLLADIAHFPNLFIARTFSKAYGLAGLRTGILMANAGAMRMVRKVASPYNVNAVALACLETALADQDFVTDYVAQVVTGRARLQEEFARRGIPYWKSHANFVLARIGAHHADFVQAMREMGILVRSRHNDPGCAGCVRITVGTAAQTDKLLAALGEVCSSLKIGRPLKITGAQR